MTCHRPLQSYMYIMVDLHCTRYDVKYMKEGINFFTAVAIHVNHSINQHNNW